MKNFHFHYIQKQQKKIHRSKLSLLQIKHTVLKKNYILKYTAKKLQKSLSMKIYRNSSDFIPMQRNILHLQKISCKILYPHRIKFSRHFNHCWWLGDASDFQALEKNKHFSKPNLNRDTHTFIPSIRYLLLCPDLFNMIENVNDVTYPSLCFLDLGCQANATHGHRLHIV